jgi:uncharacterized protein YaaN involved in tellurite resistance
MSSPFSKLKSPQNKVAVNTTNFGQISTPSPLATIPDAKVIMPNLVVSETDIERLGSDLSRSVGQTTEKIVSKMSVARFDDLGKILVSIQAEAGKLDPKSIQKSGIAGWVQRTFGNVKLELTTRLKNADSAFDDLADKISTHITIHSEWVKDLEALYKENMDRYKMITETIAKGEQWQSALKSQIDNWEVISPDDPDVGMKIQAKRDAEAMLNRIGIKLDSFLRLKTVVESNAPKIKSQQETSRTTIMTLKDVIDQTIPMIKMEFTMYIQSLDAQQSIKLVDSAKQLANTTLTKSADTAKQSAIDAATALNSPVIETETINHIRNKMLETLNEVKQIEVNSKIARDNDAKLIGESQKQYLMALQQQKAV